MLRPDKLLPKFKPNHQNHATSHADLWGHCPLVFRSVGYKWRTASCVEANDYFCALREPICHPGYTWLPDIPSSCFKVTSNEGFKASS